MLRRLFLSVVCAAVVGSLLFVPTLGQSGDTARLTLDQCLRMALENNLDLISAKKDPAIAEQQIDIALAPFDPTLGANATHQDFDSGRTIIDNLTAQSGPAQAEQETLQGDINFNHTLKFGGNYELRYDLFDLDNSSTSVDTSTGLLTDFTNTNSNNGLVLTYTMPLLRGFGTEVNTVNVLLARNGLDISREDLRLQAMTTLQSVEDAYWDVLSAAEALRISRLALKRAEDLLELNKKKVEVGTLAPIEITEAEAGVASQVEAVIVAEATLENAEDALLQLLAVPESDPMWEQTLEVTDQPSFTPIQVNLESAIDTALEQRPEMITARQRLSDNELSQRVARKGVRHDLSLTATVSPDKQNDSDQIVIPGGNLASNTTTEAEDDSWSIGLNYSIPLKNRRAKADYAVARLNTEKTQVAVRSAEQDIRVDVRRSARNVESGIQRVQAARKNVELQQKKLEAEQKKYDNGMSTSFEVLTFQNDLADAELSEIRARLDYLKSLTALERAKGTLLEARGLTLGE